MLGLIWIQTVWHTDGIPEMKGAIAFRRKKSADYKIMVCKFSQHASNEYYIKESIIVQLHACS